MLGKEDKNDIRDKCGFCKFHGKKKLRSNIYIVYMNNKSWTWYIFNISIFKYKYFF